MKVDADPSVRGGSFLQADSLFSKDRPVLYPILIILLILLLLGAIPTWPHSRGWGYAPSGILGIILIVLIVLLLMGQL